MSQFEHKTAQQLHANRRARERLGVRFNRHQAHEIILQIEARKISMLGPAGPWRGWYKTEIQGREAWLVFDSSTRRVVTVLHYCPVELAKYLRRKEQTDRDRAKALADRLAKKETEKSLKEEARRKAEERRKLFESMTPEERAAYKAAERAAKLEHRIEEVL